VLSNEKTDDLILVATNNHKHKQHLRRKQKENPSSI